MTARVGVAVLMLATSLVMLWPFTNVAEIGSALHAGDGRVQAWVLAWVGHALGTGHALFDANMFYPARATLAHTDHMVALGALGAPLWWLTQNAVLEFNVLQLAGPAASACAMFLLAHAWTRDAAAAMVAGLAYGFSSFTLLHNAHLNLTWNAGLPLTVLAFERWWAAPTWPRLALWWLPALFTILVSWYLAVILTLLMIPIMISLVLQRGWQDVSVRAVQLGAAVALGAAVVVPFLAPYVGRGSEAGEAQALAADWRSYVVPSEHTVIGRALFQLGLIAPRGIWGEGGVFLGWTLCALAAAGTVFSRRRALLLVIALVGVLLSFGPSASGWAPYDMLARLPGVGGFRATARFALLVVFSVSLLAAFGLVWIRRAAPRWAARPLAAAAAGLVLFEVFVVDFPAGRPSGEPMPAVYARASADGARAAVALPMYAGLSQWYHEGDYLLYSTTGNFVPLANGIGRWIPPEYLVLGDVTRFFPSAETAAVLRLYGITHVVFHGARYGRQAPVLLDRVRQGHDFSIVQTFGSDTLLRVNER